MSEEDKETEETNIEQKNSEEDTEESIEAIEKIEKAAESLAEHRGNPILVLYYSDQCGKITRGDLANLEMTLDDIGHIDTIDVIIHTHGGDVSSSYFLAQQIRSKCDNMNIIVPDYAYSGGTLIALAGDQIEMYSSSKLSPIDVQLSNEEEDETLPLINFDKYIEFINEVTEDFDLDKEENRAEIISRIMVEMSDKLHPFEIGHFYRMSQLRDVYAEKLLLSYMFPQDPKNEMKAKKIVENLTLEAPSHEFEIDRNLASDFGLKIEDMDKTTYELSKTIIGGCKQSEEEGVICKYPSPEHELKVPYFEIFGT